MKFNSTLIKGKLIKRYKRFFTDIEVNNKVVTAHCPNTGSMMGLLNKGNKIWFSVSNNPKRKLRYSLEIIRVEKSLVGINTLLANKLVFEALKSKKIKSLIRYDNIKAEVKFSNSTRFDFLISDTKEKCLLEVKNVTLLRNNNIAEFPDAITSRGTKHLIELINAKKRGFHSCIIYLIQRQDCKVFKIADDIDINYKIAFDKAIKGGVKILCYDCKINDEEVKLNNQIKLV